MIHNCKKNWKTSRRVTLVTVYGCQLTIYTAVALNSIRYSSSQYIEAAYAN